MKRKWLKKLVSLGLVLTMLAGLTACGENEQQTNTPGKNDPNAELAKQGVFSEQVLEMPDFGEDYSVRTLKQANDKIYALMDVYSWTEDGEYNNTMQIVSWNLDGTNAQVNELQKDLESAEEQGNQEEPNEQEASDNQEETPVEDDVAADKIVAGNENYYEYTGFSHLSMTDDMLYGMKEHYEEDYSDPQNPISKNEFYVCGWSLDGQMKWEIPVEGLQTEESYSYIQSILPAKDGNVVLMISGDKPGMMELNAEGTLSESRELPANASVLTTTSNIFANEDGTYTVIYWDEADNYSMKMATYDMASDTISESVKMPDYFSMFGYGTISAGVNNSILYSANDGVYSYNVGDEQPTQILSFTNSDLATTNMNHFLMLDETRLVGFYYDNATNKNLGSIFTKVNPEDIKDKGVLVLAGFYVDYNTKNRVVEYNKTNENYRIVIKEYQQYATMDDYMAGYTKLNNDIIAGNMPDILVVDNSVDINKYISKGLLADVSELIAKDEELSQKEFMENVFEAYKVDGKLYQAIPSFYVRSVIGKKSIVGDRDTWTMQEAQQVLAGMPEGTKLFPDQTRTGFFYTMMQYCGNDFIDVSTGKCAFDTQGFKDLLTYAKTLPAEFGDDYWNEQDWAAMEAQYRNNTTLLMECHISDARNMNRNINGYFGEEISYIGFPNESGNGSVLGADQMYAISAKSLYPDGAWDFVRYYFSDEYQKEEIYNFPIVKEIFMEKVNEAKENPYYLDENGEKVEYEDTFYMNGEEIPIPNMSQKQADEFVSFIESVNQKVYSNTEIQNIVQEEAEAFFSGQKSVDEVAALIQNRVQLYVNENM